MLNIILYLVCLIINLLIFFVIGILKINVNIKKI